MTTVLWYVADTVIIISHIYDSEMRQKVSQEHGKDFRFYKQHAVSHVIEDIEQKGTTDNFCTRPGEGFIQEVKEAYEQTNKRDADHQVRIYRNEI